MLGDGIDQVLENEMAESGKDIVIHDENVVLSNDG